jgi:hypothetical protein
MKLNKLNKLNPFSTEVLTASNTGSYIAEASFMDICGTQLDANKAIERAKAKGISRIEALKAFNIASEKSFRARVKSGSFGFKKESRHSDDAIEETTPERQAALDGKSLR